MTRLLLVAVTSTVLLIPIAALLGKVVTNSALAIALTFTIGYVAVPALMLRLWPAQRGKVMPTMEQALARGELQIQEYAAVAAAELEEVEDEGLHFLLALPDNRTLYLNGQYLYEPVERKVFPASNFKLFRNKATAVVYGIECAGPPFTSWPTYSTFAKSPIESTVELEDGVIYAQTLDQLLAELGIPPAQQVRRDDLDV